MKNNFILMLLVILSFSKQVLAQKSNKEIAENYLSQKGEVIFNFKISNTNELNSITKELSIVNYDEVSKTVKVMANTKQFSHFLNKKTPFVVLLEDNEIGYRKMTTDIRTKATTFPLEAYPTYADYETMMNAFATNNPTLCKVENIGATTEGDKSLLFVKLSDNVNSNEQEPKVMYTSSMHGDEIAGYPMMLNLIDYLLNAYNDTTHVEHTEIKQLLDNNEVWINPLANPDGTFNNSATNTTVAYATRGNANNIDLNRNYPDPEDGSHPDGNSYQTETKAFMTFADSKHFVLSANFHGGAELINYPWDTFKAAHPDEDYFLHISKEYRDLCQSNSPNGYFDDRNNGITNGYAWYEVQGGRQDYQIYYKKGREVTIELSSSKTPQANQLVNYWNYNKKALIEFLKQVNYGLRGVVTDAVTNQPIKAKVTVIGKESFDSWTPTELPYGDYYRPIKAGIYTVLYEAECYETMTLTGVYINDKQTVIKNVKLMPITNIAPTGLAASNIQTTAATLNWDSVAGTTYDIRYRVVGEEPWSTSSTNGYNDLIINELTVNTQYEAQVRSNCINGVSSPYSTSINFTTLTIAACTGINNYPYKESFENGFGLWTNENGVDIDWRRHSGSTPSGNTGPSSAQDGTYYIYTEASTSAGNPYKTAILNSPCINFTNSTNSLLEFYYHMFGSNMGTIEVLVSTNNGLSYTTIWSQEGNKGNVWKKASIDLSSYAGTVIKLQLKGTTGKGIRSDMAIDDINIISTTQDTEAPSTPLNLKAFNVTNSVIDLYWNESIDNVGVTGYEIYQGDTLIKTVATTNYTVSGLTSNTEYSFSVRAKDLAGNKSEFSNILKVTTETIDTESPTTPSNLIDLEITQTSVHLSWDVSTDNVGVIEYNIYSGVNLMGTTLITNFTVTNLSPNTNYTFIVKAKDAAGNNSDPSNTLTITTLENSIDYCISKGNNAAYEFIDYVELGEIKNTSGSNLGYGDFTNLIANITYGTNTIVLSAGFNNSSFLEFWSVWIDYNHDGKFEDIEQIVKDSTSREDKISFNFNIPTTTITGKTRVRVSMKYNKESNSCEAFEFGEVEDYTVNIQPSSILFKNNSTLVNKNTDEFSIYPNPVKHSIIHLKPSNKKNTSFKIINHRGQEVMKGTIINNSIDLGQLSSGIYFLETNNKQKIITQRFIKE